MKNEPNIQNIPVRTPEGKAIRDALVNTLCPKLGAAQWSCTRDECNCHRKPFALPYCPFCRKAHEGGDTCMGHHP